MIARLRRSLARLDGSLLLALLLPLIGLLPIFGAGVPNAADAPFHAHRIFALAELISAGELYPRWVPWFHLGYGYPVFNFYPPGATHIGAWLHLAGFDVATAYHLTTALAWCLGSLGMFLLARRLAGVPGAWLACALWVYAPSRFFEYWWQGSLAQIVATSFVPLLFYGLLRCRDAPSPRGSLWIAAPLSLIVLSHTPTSYITALFLAPCSCFACLPWRKPKPFARRVLWIAIGLLLGAGLSAIYWLPALAELKYVKIGGELPDTVDFLLRNFLLPRELISGAQIIDRGDATLLMPRSLGLAGAGLSALGFAALLLRRRLALALMLAGGLGLALFLTLEPSLDLWLTLPGFKNLRFPERLLRMAALFIGLLGGCSLLILPPRWRERAALLASALVIFQALPLMRPRDDDKVWQNLSAWDEIEMEYAERNWGTTSYNEYLPIGGDSIPFDLPESPQRYRENPLQIRVDEAQFARLEERITYRYLDDGSIYIAVKGPSTIFGRFRQFNYPGWRATLDGENWKFEDDKPHNLLKLRLRTGEHIVKLEYVGTPTQHIASLISVLTLALCLALRWRLRDTARPGSADRRKPITRRTLLIALALLGMAIINAAWIQDAFFRMRSPVDAPAYMGRRTDAVFDNTVELIGYTLSGDSIAPGFPLEIRLYWRGLGGEIPDYRTVARLMSLSQGETWALSRPQNPEGGKFSRLAATQFMSDGHRLALNHAAQPWTGQIVVQLERDESGEMARLPDGSSHLVLPERVRIETDMPAFDGHSRDLLFGEMLALRCVEMALDESALRATLHWETLKTPSSDLHLFLHGMNGDELVTQADAPPLGADYPTSLWRKGQRLISRHKLPLDEAVQGVALGLYDPVSGDRLEAREDGVLSDRVWIAPESASCGG